MKPTASQLQQAVREMDTVAQTCFAQIQAIARLALAAMETPAGARDLASIGHALEAIAAQAFDGENAAGRAAEEVQASYTDEASQRRQTALRASQTVAAS